MKEGRKEGRQEANKEESKEAKKQAKNEGRAVCKRGGLPSPPLFEAVQGCLKACGRLWPMVLAETHHANIVFANGGAAPPIMRAFCLQRGGGLRPPFKQCKLASKYMSFLS